MHTIETAETNGIAGPRWHLVAKNETGREIGNPDCGMSGLGPVSAISYMEVAAKHRCKGVGRSLLLAAVEPAPDEHDVVHFHQVTSAGVLRPIESAFGPAESHGDPERQRSLLPPDMDPRRVRSARGINVRCARSAPAATPGP